MTEPRASHRLWFVAHRAADATYRGACYVCGWWSDPVDDHDAGHALLIEHLDSEAHGVQYRRGERDE